MDAFDVFISHSHQDADVAESLVTLLRKSLEMSAERIRCTSVAGYTLSISTPVAEQLRLEVLESRAFIAVLTDAALESAYVLFEMGARWGAGSFFAPLLVSSRDKNLLRGPLADIHSLACDNERQVEQFLSDIAKHLNARLVPSGIYQEDIDNLVQLSNAPRTRSTVGLLRRELAGLYESLSSVLTPAQNTHLQTLILKKAPDYTMIGPLRNELRSLEHWEFIRAQPGRTLDEVQDGTRFQMSDYLRITGIGRGYLRWLVESA